MSCEEYEVVTKMYVGRDNPVIIVPYSDVVARELYDMTDVTLVQVWADLKSSTVSGDAVTAESTDVPQTITRAKQSSGEWQIDIRVGRFVGIVAGEYNLRVVLTEPNTPNGVVVANDLRVDLIGAP